MTLLTIIFQRGVVNVTSANIQSASNWVTALRAGGGTYMLNALNLAFSDPKVRPLPFVHLFCLSHPKQPFPDPLRSDRIAGSRCLLFIRWRTQRQRKCYFELRCQSWKTNQHCRLQGWKRRGFHEPDRKGA